MTQTHASDKDDGLSILSKQTMEMASSLWSPVQHFESDSRGRAMMGDDHDDDGDSDEESL